MIPIMLEAFAPLWLAGLLGAGMMAAVMASESQILAPLDDVHRGRVRVLRRRRALRGGRAGADRPCLRGAVDARCVRDRATSAAEHLRFLAVQFAFSGYAALSPLLIAALFWKRSTKWGALAVTVWVAVAVIYTARVPGALAWHGLLPVVPMTIVSAVLMIGVSLATPAPSIATLRRYGFGIVTC